MILTSRGEGGESSSRPLISLIMWFCKKKSYRHPLRWHFCARKYACACWATLFCLFPCWTCFWCKVLLDVEFIQVININASDSVPKFWINVSYESKIRKTQFVALLILLIDFCASLLMADLQCMPNTRDMNWSTCSNLTVNFMKPHKLKPWTSWALLFVCWLLKEPVWLPHRVFSKLLDLAWERRFLPVPELE